MTDRPTTPIASTVSSRTAPSGVSWKCAAAGTTAMRASPMASASSGRGIGVSATARHCPAHRLEGAIGRAAAKVLGVERNRERDLGGRCRATFHDAEACECNRRNRARRPSRDLHLPHHLAQHRRVDHPVERCKRLGQCRVPRQSGHAREWGRLIGGEIGPVDLERHQAEIGDLRIGREPNHDVHSFIDKLLVKALAALFGDDDYVTEVEAKTCEKARKPVTRAFRETAADAEAQIFRYSGEVCNTGKLLTLSQTRACHGHESRFETERSKKLEPERSERCRKLRAHRFGIGLGGGIEHRKRGPGIFGVNVHATHLQRLEHVGTIPKTNAALNRKSARFQRQRHHLGEDAVLDGILGCDNDRLARAARKRQRCEQTKGCKPPHHAGSSAGVRPVGSSASARRKPTICSTRTAENGMAPSVAIARATSTDVDSSVAAVMTAAKLPQMILAEAGGSSCPFVVIIDRTNVPESAEVTRKMKIKARAAALRTPESGK